MRKWSDGEPVTADDFVYAWRRVLEPARAASYAYFLYVDFKNAEAISSGKLPGTALGARAIDAKTLEVTLAHPVPFLLEMLTQCTTYPVPKHVVEDKGDDWVKPGNYVSNGAYVLVELGSAGLYRGQKESEILRCRKRQDGSRVLLRYGRLRGRAAPVPRRRNGRRRTGSRSGQIDVGTAEYAGGDVNQAGAAIHLDYMVVNFAHKPFDDLRVRQALESDFGSRHHHQKDARRRRSKRL